MACRAGWGEATALSDMRRIPSRTEALSVLAEVAHGRGDVRRRELVAEPDEDRPESAESIAAKACGCVLLAGEVTLRLQYWKLLAGRGEFRVR